MVATDSAEVATDPPEARQRTGRLVARRTRRREIVAAALKETALRSTVRLSAGPPVHESIAYLIVCAFFFSLGSERLSTDQIFYLYAIQMIFTI